MTGSSEAEARIAELSRDLGLRIDSLERLLDLVPVGILIMRDKSQGGEIIVNRHGARLLGECPGRERGGTRPMAQPFRLIRDDRELSLAEHPLQLAAFTGEVVPAFEGLLVRSDGSRVDVTIEATQLFHEDGQVRGSIAAILDLSERRQAEARQQALVYELQHRVKNIIATIGALATRTLRDDVSARVFVDTFVGRLRGMASTQELLARTGWRGTSLARLVETALQEHLSPDLGRIAIGGPEVQMMPNAAATLGMIFYELAVNALKYGALSETKGKMEVSWRMAAEPEAGILLTWTESGGRPLDQGAASGFGTGFVRRSIAYELRGRATLQPTHNGLRWSLEFPSAQNVRAQEGSTD